MHKLFLSVASLVCAAIGFSLPAQAQQSNYALMVNKNLFRPDRTAWFMSEAQKKAPPVAKNIPRLDLKKVNLLGTVVTKKRRRALISTSARHTRSDTEFYTIGDYIQGYLVKEIEPKRVVLFNQGLDEECSLMLKADKPHRSHEKTALPQPSAAAAGRRAPRLKAETPQDLIARMKTARNVLKNKDSELVRKQAERDFNKLQQQIDQIPAQERQELIMLKKEIDRTRAGRN